MNIQTTSNGLTRSEHIAKQLAPNESVTVEAATSTPGASAQVRIQSVPRRLVEPRQLATSTLPELRGTSSAMLIFHTPLPPRPVASSSILSLISAFFTGLFGFLHW